MPASKNSSASKKKKSSLKDSSPYWAHLRGLQSEEKVQAHYLKKGYHLLGQRVRTPFAEVDLLFLAPEGHALMVEVKTANLVDFHLHRISWKQKQRLLRAVQFLASSLDCLVEVHWAFVTKDGAVTTVEDVCG